MARVLLIGIDGMDAALFARWRSHLPHLSRLAEEGVGGTLPSVFPPDSVPAWTTIYTGLTPGEHGVFETIDYLTSSSGDAGPEAFAGRTFWDAAGRRGRRVCVVNAFMAYPVWPVNGVMVSGPVFVSGRAQSYPAGALARLPRAELGGVTEYPYRWELGRFAQRAAMAARRQHALAAALMAQERWDLFFVCLLTLDRVQHFFWRFADPTDPAYPGPHAFARVIFDHYRLMDSIVGSLRARMGDAAVMVLSDHGHGPRPARLFHLNEWLRRRGYLTPKEKRGRGWSAARAVEKAKAAAFAAATRLAMEDALYAAARLVPRAGRARLKDSSYAIDAARSRAYAGDLGGSSGAGGVVIRDGNPRVAERVAAELREVVDPETGRRIVEWARPREAMIRGRHADRAPHLLFRLKPGYGVSRSVFGGLFSASPTHRRVSGGHRDAGVLAASREFAGAAPRALWEVYAAVLNALGA